MEFNLLEIVSIIGGLGISGFVFWLIQQRILSKNELKEVFFDSLDISFKDNSYVVDITIRNPTNHIVTMTSFHLATMINDNRAYISSITEVTTRYKVITLENGLELITDNEQLGEVEGWIMPRGHAFEGRLIQQIKPKSVDRFKIEVGSEHLKKKCNNVKVTIDYNIKDLNLQVLKNIDFIQSAT